MFFGLYEGGYYSLTFYAAILSGILGALIGKYISRPIRLPMLSCVLMALPMIVTIRMIMYGPLGSFVEVFGLFVIGHIVSSTGYLYVWAATLIGFFLGVFLRRRGDNIQDRV